MGHPHTKLRRAFLLQGNTFGQRWQEAVSFPMSLFPSGKQNSDFPHFFPVIGHTFSNHSTLSLTLGF